MNLYDLPDYSLAKVVCEDLPIAINSMKLMTVQVDSGIKSLEPYIVYKDAAVIHKDLKSLHGQLATSIDNMNRFLKSYEKIYYKKGITSDVKED